MANPHLTSDVTIREFLSVASSADSTPGVVAAAAAAGALGTALLVKVAALPTTRSESIDDHTLETESELKLRSNLEGRLGSLTDVVHAKAVVDKIASLSDEAALAADTATLSIQRPPA